MMLVTLGVPLLALFQCALKLNTVILQPTWIECTLAPDMFFVRTGVYIPP